MRGHLQERRPGVWRVYVSDGHAPDGKRRQISRTVRGSKRDAQRELTKMMRERDEGRLFDGRQALARYLDTWLAGVSKVSKRGRPLAPTTRQRYRDAVRHISGIIGRVRLNDLRPEHVETLRDRLLAEGNLAPQTVADVMRVLSQALGRAEARGLAQNVAAANLVDRPTGEERKFEVIDAVLGERLLEAARGKTPWDAACHLALGLGLRREECLGLRWQDVTDETLSVVQTLTAADGGLHFGPPKSKAGARTLPLPGFVAAALRRHRREQADRLWPLGGRSELVIDNGLGLPYQPASFSGAWRVWARDHGFKGVTFHTLRHGAATLLLAAGVGERVAAEIMGHADTRILRRYQDVVPDLMKDAAARMERLLGEY